MKVELGKVYRDSITGFTGVATSVTEFLYSCRRVCIQPRELHEGKPIEQGYFDEHQLELVEVRGLRIAKEEQEDARPGGPGDCAKPHSCPSR